jgi:transcriptional regulator with XRE-family HTH domain
MVFMHAKTRLQFSGTTGKMRFAAHGRDVPMGFKEIGRKIQKAREEQGMTQIDLARALGITQAALSNYELGKRRLYLHKIEEIARLLRKNIDYFVPSTETYARANPHDASGSTQRIISRIEQLDENGLGQVSAYLDFLEWRNRHG